MKRILIVLALLGEAAMAGPATQPATDQLDAPIAVITQAYDVHDLIHGTAEYPLEQWMLPTMSGEQNQAGGADANRQMSGWGQAGSSGPTTIERADALVKLIEETVEPGDWKDNGGNVGNLRLFDGRLVVTNTQKNQDEIQKLLTTLSDDAAQTVRVNAKWILLSSEEMNALVKGSAKDGAFTFVDEKTLSGSKLYCEGQTLGLSGQTVHIACGQEQTYLSDATPVVGTGAVAYSPTMSTVRSGVALQVTPTLTGSSVLLDLRNLVGNVSDLGSGALALPASTQPTTLPSDAVLIQRPRIDVQQFQTTVRLPLGADVLIGGMSRVPGDQEPAASQLYLVIRVDGSH